MGESGGPGSVRRILHVDMDAFFASVEQRDHPELRGRPVAVGGDSGRGVVAAASYEARVFGVRSAMPMSRALRLCRDLVVVRPRFESYKAVSDRVFEIFRTVTPLVEPLSLDEAYLDVTENAWGEPLAREVARRIKREIRARTGLTASAGVAANKFLAKIASGWRKPDGLTVIPPERADSFLRGLPVDALWGVGPKTAAKLRGMGLATVIDLRHADPDRLRAAVGSFSETLIELAHGRDERPVEPEHERKSVGSENTFEVDLTEAARIRAEVEALAADGAEWLERKALFARTVILKVRYADFTTITRSDTRDPATREPAALAARAVDLLRKTEAGARPVRLLGVSFHGLRDGAETAADPEPTPVRRDRADARQLRLPFGILER